MRKKEKGNYKQKKGGRESLRKKECYEIMMKSYEKRRKNVKKKGKLNKGRESLRNKKEGKLQTKEGRERKFKKKKIGHPATFICP